jgi:4-amino-4-deoxy-L-arabinose transferase-like glycosyltransferase
LGFVPRWAVLVLLGAAFVLKAIVLSQLADHPLTQPDAGLDTTAYVKLARQVLAGNIGLGPGVYYVSPLYIYFLAAGLAVLHSFTAVRTVQIVLGTASIGFIYLSARRWFGERAAFIASVLAALTGLFTFYEVLILQASIDAFLTSAALYALTVGVAELPPEGESHGNAKDRSQVDRGGRAVREDRVASAFRRKSLLISGVIFGIQTLNRPNILVAALGVAMVMLLVTRRVVPRPCWSSGSSPACHRQRSATQSWRTSGRSSRRTAG